MYHIKSDKRSQKSAKLITEAVMNILEEKNFEDMTITDIERKSFVARSTFYRLFDNTLDVLTYKCDLIFLELNTLHKESKQKTLEEIMILAGDYWMKNSQILEILTNSGHQSILQKSFERHFQNTVRNFLGDDKDVHIVNDPYISAMITSLITSALLTWHNQGRKENAKELWERIKSNYKMLSFMMNDENRM